MLNTKNIKPFFFIISLFAGLIAGQATQAQALIPQQRFDAANNLYQQNKFTEAAAAYQELMDEGYTQKMLYFNAGNAYYKAGKNGSAIYSYEKALQLAPNDAVIKHNLELANQKVNGYVEELPLVFFQQWWQQLSLLHSPNGWATGAILLFWLLTAGVLLNTFLPGWKNKFLRWGNYTLGTLFVLYLIFSISTYFAANDHSTGIVMHSNIRTKTAPDDNSRDSFEVQEGMKVHVSDATKDYCKIALADGKTGWISCAYIKRL
ncbi:MAG TPA: tetratricopeptide repeat protein [Chitinophaga sp.]|uniref:tetratricopeptide repeat protein n=1 Tax=Chitinophaga sp. TaxID=1869181 RepID=UPI002BBC008C|nr:tetratricopeptide repeat protein [Chitinophaga sp.]HVI43895.1 tetratricopeptide repeat protein [Chitinophaga sp.]